MKSLYFAIFLVFLSNFDVISVIISYPDIEEDFLDFLAEYRRRSDIDPVWKWTPGWRSLTCQAIRTTNIFKMVSETIPFTKSLIFEAVKRQSSITRIEERKHSAYNNITVYIQEEAYQLPFFRCLIHAQMNQYWYATYGFHDFYLYIFKETESEISEDAPHLEMIGIIETRVKINEMFRGGRHLERYFLNSHRMWKPISPKFDKLCTLTANQQFRLCCVVKDALKKNNNAREFFYTSKRDHTCLENQLVRVYEDEEHDRVKYFSTDVFTNVILCGFSENQTERTFFLTSDPGEDFAVFILEENHKNLDANELNVVGHARNINVIKYAKEIY